MQTNPSADEDWYLHQSSKRGSPLHCPLAENDRCPRYFASQSAAARVGAIPIDLPSDLTTRLLLKWESSDVLTNHDTEVGIWQLPDGSLRGVSNFCPEVTARIFGLYCTSLRTFPDEDARIGTHRKLERDQVNKDDPQWNWMVVEPKHYSECHEYSVYGGQEPSNSRNTNGRRGTLSQSVRWTIFNRDGFRCVYCGASGGPQSVLQVDHKISVASGGTDDIGNLVTACEKCNSGKGAKSVCQ